MRPRTDSFIALAATSVLSLAASIQLTSAQGPDLPRPGLTARQTRDAVEAAKGAMRELRKKTEGALRPDADRREYIVAVELVVDKEAAERKAAQRKGAERNQGEAPTAKPSGNEPEGQPPDHLRALVTSYRYFDDITVFSTVDLRTGKVIDVQAAQHMRTPLSEAEFEEAQELARHQSDAVKRLYETHGEHLNVYPQFSQYSKKDDPRIHRVVHLTYRVGKRDLSYPRPQVDLTTRQIETPPPEPDPRSPPPR